MADEDRKVQIKRYFKGKEGRGGAPVAGTEDRDVWIDMELITGFTTEQGSGPTFKRRFWTLDLEETERTVKWTKIYKADDPDNFVLVPIPEIVYFESGSGPEFRRFSLEYDNSEENEARTVHTARVFHAEYDSKGNTIVDQGDYLDVEVIDEFVTEYGSGPTFQREFWSPANGQIPVSGDSYSVDGEKWPSYREEQQ